MSAMFLRGDAEHLPFADDTFDLVLGSPPYQEARTYGIGADRDCADWVEWMLRVTAEATRVSKGLVIWIAANITRDWNYQPGCEGLMWEWWKRGGRGWRPAFWHRSGIPGSGGDQWLRADVEYAMVMTKCVARIPWADNTANGWAPKWQPGGDPSNRLKNGKRYNENPPGPNRRQNGTMKTVRRCTRGKSGGDTVQEDMYVPPEIANPGVLVSPEETLEETFLRWVAEGDHNEGTNCVKGIKVGGGLLGHDLAHDNEAPYPQQLAAWFVRGWCPPGGLVLDPFSGSGTTCAAAIQEGRNGIGLDLRHSQCELARRRCSEVQPVLF